MLNCSLCNHCGAIVEMKDTFRENCIECGEESSWNDDQEQIRKAVSNPVSLEQ